jgi:hypothetical protein
MSDLFVDNIKHQSSQGSGTITLGASGETVALASGASQTMAVNTPAFHVVLSAGQSISDNTETIVSLNSETFDTDNAYDTSTYKFTPQVAGKYFVYSNIYLESGANTNMNRCFTNIYKNTTQMFFNFFDPRDNPGRAFTCNASGTIELNGSTDYVLVKGLIVGQASGSGLEFAGGSGTYFGAYKIIE